MFDSWSDTELLYLQRFCFGLAIFFASFPLLIMLILALAEIFH